jgi:hypothetical protein
MADINIPEFIATVAAQLKEANVEANERIRDKQDDPFLLLRDLQLQIAFTAEESKTKDGRLELKPWVPSAGGGLSKSQRNEIVHTVTLNLSPAVVQDPDGSGLLPTEPSAPSGGLGLVVNNESVARSILRDNPELWKSLFPYHPEDDG